MPEAKFPTPELNLLSGNELETTSSGKFLKWALSWGRRIVVLTELVVILAFLSRFYFDTKVAELNDKIVQQKDVVLAMADFEKTFRLVSDRVAKADNLEKTTSILGIYERTETLIPAGVSLLQLSVDAKGVAFSGSCTEEVLETMVDGFRGDKNFSNISVERIAKSNADKIVDFSFKAIYGNR